MKRLRLDPDTVPLQAGDGVLSNAAVEMNHRARR